jgi:hypothetical protein
MLIDTEKLRTAIAEYYDKVGKAMERNSHLLSEQRLIFILSALEKGEHEELELVKEVERLSTAKYNAKHFCSLPDSVKQALNSDDGIYRP